MTAPAPLRLLVAEDEPLARQLLLDLLAEQPGVEVVAVAENGLEALRLAEQHAPDALLLDVEMPKLDGFEVLELLEAPPPVVFVTAYDAYAVRAFEKAALDYLQKPLRAERLEEALERVRSLVTQRRAAPSGAPLERPRRSGAELLTRIAVKDGADVAVIPVEALEWARSEDDYVLLSSGGRTWLKHQSLTSLEQSLDPRLFVRIHRTCLVNSAVVVRIEPETRDRFWVQVAGGALLPASRQGEKRLRGVLGL
jgi:two-component system LytT family response regulator